jgi:hypothetical protein
MLFTLCTEFNIGPNRHFYYQEYIHVSCLSVVSDRERLRLEEFTDCFPETDKPLTYDRQCRSVCSNMLLTAGL